MNFGSLNVAKASEPATQEQVVASDFVAPYFALEVDEQGAMVEDSQLDVVSRMFYSRRAVSARPIDSEVVEAIDAGILNRLISATGVNNNIVRKTPFATRLFFNFANKDGDLITREVLVSIVKASHIFDVEVDADGNQKPVFMPLPEYLLKHGFVKKAALNKSDSSKISIPLVVDLNSIRLSLSGQNYVAKAAATGYISNGNEGDFRIDIRVPETNIRVGDFEKACAVVLEGADEKVKASALSFVKTAVLFSLSMSENLRIYKGEQDGYLPRDYYRMFGALLSEVYYGKAEFSNKETNFGFHALLSGVFDLATLGGGFQDVPEGRVVAGKGWNISVLNANNR